MTRRLLALSSALAAALPGNAPRLGEERVHPRRLRPATGYAVQHIRSGRGRVVVDLRFNVSSHTYRTRTFEGWAPGGIAVPHSGHRSLLARRS